MSHILISEAARRLRETGLDVRPRDLSDLFWQGKLDSGLCPMMGGRRMIPTSYLPTIAELLRNRRRRGAKQEAVAHAG